MLKKTPLYQKYRFCFLLFLAFAIPVKAETFVMSGSVCQALNPAASRGMRWSYEGVKNVDRQDRWVVCPLPNQYISSLQDTSFLFTLSSERGSFVKTTCFIRYVSYDREDFVTRTYTFTIPPKDSYTDRLDVINDGTLAASITCKLPQGISVNLIGHETSF